jgi:hypothetical protein
MRSGPTIATRPLAVLRTLREPSASMLAAGDGPTWERMIAAAIEDETMSEN